jgi:hypothetical protein
MEEANTLTGAAPPPIAVIKVKVEADLIGGAWQFDVKPDDLASGPYVKNGKIEVPVGPQTRIEFKLQGTAAGKLDFKESDPFWAEQGQCPTSRCSDPDICIVSCSKNKLEINDRNTKAADLHYRLNFVDSAGGDHWWDPIIRNGGGGP